MTYACHNRPAYRAITVVQDGWWLDGQTRTAKMTSKPFAMTKDCQYTKSALGRVDAKCNGCKWHGGLATPQKA